VTKGYRSAPLKELHIRVRGGRAAGSWQWELITAEGHVANVSEAFWSRKKCEAEAKRQDLPVVGLARTDEKAKERGPVSQSGNSRSVSGSSRRRTEASVLRVGRPRVSPGNGAVAGRSLFQEDVSGGRRDRGGRGSRKEAQALGTLVA